MTSPFPLVHRQFPAKLQLQIVRKMRLGELINLSYCSRRMARLVRDADITLKEMHFSNHFNCETGLTVFLSSPTSGIYEIHLRSKRDVKKQKVQARRDPKEWKGSDGLLRIERDDFECDVVFATSDDFYKACDTVVGHLRKLFPHIDDVGVRMPPRQFLANQGLRKHVKTMNWFLSFSPNHLKREEVLFLMRDDKKSVQIEDAVRDGVFYSDGLRIETVRISDASWLDFNAVVASRSRSIELTEYPLPTTSKLRSFMEKWLARDGLANLERLCVTFKTRMPHGYRDNVFHGLRYVPFKKTNENWNDATEWVNCGRNLRRSDGKVASVLLDGQTFRFLVRTPTQD